MLDTAVLEVVCHAAVDNQNSEKRKESFSRIIHWVGSIQLLAELLFSLSKLKKKKTKNKEEGREEEGRKRARKERKKKKFPRWEKRRNKVAGTRAEPLLVS